MNKKLLYLLLLLIVFSGSLFARHKDIVYMMDGSEYTGELVKISETEVVLNTTDGDVTFQKDSVRSVDLGTWRPGDGWQSKSDIDDQTLLDALELTSLSHGLRTKYPGAGYITLYTKDEIWIEADMSGKLVERRIFFITGERGKNAANYRESYFTDKSEITVDFGRAVARNRKISTIADNAIEDGSPNSWLSDYQRQKIKKFAMTGAEVGSVIDYQVTTTYDKFDAFFMPYFNHNFYSDEPIIKSVLEVHQNRDVDLRILSKHLEIKPEEEKDGSYLVTTFEVENIDPYVVETMLPPLHLILPNVVVSIRPDFNDVSMEFAKKIDEAYDSEDELKKILAKELGTKLTPESIYNFVSENYSSNGVGMHNYYPYPKPLSKLLEQPHMASHELSFLLYSFYKAAGIKSELVLVGPSVDGGIPRGCLNVNHFNHMEVRLDVDGRTMYVYPNEFLAFEHHLPPNAKYVVAIRDVGSDIEILDRLDADYAYKTPIYLCKLNTDGSLDVEFSYEANGPIGNDEFRKYKYSKEIEIENAMQELVKGIDPMANLVEYNLAGFKSLGDIIKFNYTAHVPAYAVRAGEEILAFKLPTVRFSAWDVGAQERTLPFSQPGNLYSKKEIAIQLPDGYEIEYMPESIDESVGYRSYNGEFEFVDNTIMFEQTIEGEHQRIIPAKDYEKYKKYIEKLAKFGDNWILIRKKS